MNLPEYKKRVEIANAIFDEWKDGGLVITEFDSLLKALYCETITKQQDRVRLGRFLESHKNDVEKQMNYEIDNDPHERLS